MPKINKQKSKVVKKKPAKKKKPTTVSKKPPLDISSLIKDASDFDNEGLKMNIYGMTGTGKTTLWSQFPKPIFCFMSSTGGGEFKSISKEDKVGIKAVKVDSLDRWMEYVKYVADNEFKTVVIDHLTEFQNIAVREVLGIDKVPEQLSWGFCSREEWGEIGLKIKEALRVLLDQSELNVIIIAQERVFNQDDSKDEDEFSMPYVASSASPGVSGWVGPACDYIVQTFKRPQTKEVQTTVRKKASKKGAKSTEKIVTTIKKTGKVEYCLRVGPDDVYTTKFRVPKGTELPKVIVDPTYEKLIALVNGSKV